MPPQAERIRVIGEKILLIGDPFVKSVFAQYYAPTEKELAQLLGRALIVVDTNVLLNSYRASEKTTSELFAVLFAAKAQLWMPYHIGHEYHENVDKGVRADLRGHSFSGVTST